MPPESCRRLQGEIRTNARRSTRRSPPFCRSVGSSMTIAILHISDLHFGDPSSVLHRVEVDRALSSLLAKAGRDAFVVFSGDVSFRGSKQGYSEALEALQPALNRFGINRSKVVVCPGNHDIVKSTTAWSLFEAFDSWSAEMRSDKRCTFSTESCRLLSDGEADVLVINSAYHGHIGYGLVDVEQMDKTLGQIEPTKQQGRPRIAVLHHHLIPYSGLGDESTTRNSYDVLKRLVKYDFSLVLHGHQHALLELGVGSTSTKICGVGSFRYSTPGFINGANVYRVNERNEIISERYALSKDAPDLLHFLTNS